jgi:hypothetical protein
MCCNIDFWTGVKGLVFSADGGRLVMLPTPTILPPPPIITFIASGHRIASVSAQYRWIRSVVSLITVVRFWSEEEGEEEEYYEEEAGVEGEETMMMKRMMCNGQGSYNRDVVEVIQLQRELVGFDVLLCKDVEPMREGRRRKKGKKTYKTTTIIINKRENT